jgi:hypothetical protein
MQARRAGQRRTIDDDDDDAEEEEEEAATGDDDEDAATDEDDDVARRGPRRTTSDGVLTHEERLQKLRLKHPNETDAALEFIPLTEHHDLDLAVLNAIQLKRTQDLEKVMHEPFFNEYVVR